MRSLVVLILLACFPSLVNAQAVWNGRQYNGRVCSNPNCGMCASIQRQLEMQRAQSVPVPQAASQSTQAEYRTETTMELRTYQVKRCNGRQCWYETVSQMVPVTRQVAIQKAKPIPPYNHRDDDGRLWQVPAKATPAVNMLANTELIPTPQAVVNAMLEVLQPSNKAKLFDLGSGDGRIVITAAKQFGCTAVGIELNPETIAIARANALNEYVNPLVVFFQGDVRNYDLQSAQYVTMYLYPELMTAVMPKIKSGTRIASYQHEIPGVSNTKHSIDIDGKPHFFYIGIKP